MRLAIQGRSTSIIIKVGSSFMQDSVNDNDNGTSSYDTDSTAPSSDVEWRPNTRQHAPKTSPLQYERQTAFLRAFEISGTINKGVIASGVGRRTVYQWIEHDAQGFKSRLEDARATFTDTLEQKAVEYAMALKPGQNPTMLLGLLNANLPSKWKRNATEDDPAREIMVDLRREIRAAVKETRALKSGGEVSEVSSEVGAVDGEYREIGSEDAEQG